MIDAIKRAGLRFSRPRDQLGYYFDFFQHKRLDEISAISQQAQIHLMLHYRHLLAAGEPLPSLADVEFRAFSQHGEDGIILYLLSLIGAQSRRVLEVCCGDGIECNAANFIINHGWNGLLFDSDRRKIAFGRSFYRRNQNTLPRPPVLVDAWIDVEGLNALVEQHGMTGEIDVLSLDMDGVDYWVWQALTVVSPRLVVLEFNAGLGDERCCTVPYRRYFQQGHAPDQAGYFGASLPAFVKLGQSKGYRLVGCEHLGFNAFFLRSDVAASILPAVAPAACRSDLWPALLPSLPGQEWVEV